MGIDLDNTIIDYSKSVEIYSSAYLSEKFNNIFQLRSALKSVREERDWQRAQSWIYTEGLQYAKLSPGVKNLLERLSRHQTPVFIISHKTPRTPPEFGDLDLLSPARIWIKNNIEPLGIDTNLIYFEPSRVEKIQRVIELKVSHFVDDLVEVLTDERFPKSVKKYLYDPYQVSNHSEPSIEILQRLDEM